jgi:hemoglobin
MRTLALLALLLIATPAQATTLYDDFGGEPGLRRVVERMVTNATSDKRIGMTFEESNIPRLKQMLFEQFCELTGGPCKYTGRSMVRTHAPFKITDAHFAALVEDLQSAMEAENIPFHTQNRLLALLAPMRREIVTR